MKLSIVIVSYNVKELLDQCLRSVEESAKNIQHEVFVVDNNSHDSSAEFVKKNYKNIKLIVNSQNLGFSKANNQALRQATGEYVLILNPDTELLSDTLPKMIDYMDSSKPEVAMATCKIELPTGGLDRDARRSFPTPAKALFHFSGLSKVFKGSNIFDSYYMGHISPKEETEVDSCVGAFMLARNKVLKEVEYFDEDYFFYGEDLDLCYKIKEKGYKIMYTPITKIIHHKGASSGIKKHSVEISKATKDSKKRAIVESTRAMELFYKKHYSLKYPKIVTLSVILAINLIKFIRLAKLK